jgi:hypothetical protein
MLANFWARIKTYVVDIGSALLVILAGFLWYEKSQKDAAQAEVKDQADQQKIDALAQSTATLDGQNADEAAKRAALQKQLETEQNAQPDQDAILRALNDPNLGK